MKRRSRPPGGFRWCRTGDFAGGNVLLEGPCDLSCDLRACFWPFWYFEKFLSCITYVFQWAARVQVPLSAPIEKKVVNKGRSEMIGPFFLRLCP